MIRICIPFVFSFFLVLSSYAQDATYKIEFISNWSSSTHPTDYPSGSAHWSPLIGTTHQNAAFALQLGVVASDGVEQVAETGGTSILTQEINTLITAGVAYEVINGSGLGSGPGTITINDVDVDANFPYISLITMIAPSPDWVAMIGNQKLTDNSGNWINAISVDVYATDAGTDSGATYNSPNADITPHIDMESLQTVVPFSNEIVGTFVFTLEQVLSTQQEELQNAIFIYPNPAKDFISFRNNSDVFIDKAEIYAVNGKRLITFSNLSSNENLTVKSLTSGLYFLKVYSDQGTLIQKLILE
ncbi:MAG: T9SS type A sorting domain-containing protein [Flavobacteriaceae bacterium]|nr:T9SS type A sorting domain-containing protein [Flavobacteriaceae bacterium]